MLSLTLIMIIPSCSSEKSELTKTAGRGDKTSPAATSPDKGSKEVVPSLQPAPDEENKQGGSASQNTLPSLTKAYFKFESENGVDVLKIFAEGTDKDDDEVTFTYEWKKNSEPAGGEDSISGFKRGDKISVKITPYDGKGYGRSKTLNTEIQNTSPHIIAHNEYRFDGTTYSYQVKASDPDGDSLTYDLKSGPPGMSISMTGLITWIVPSRFSGKVPVSISVSDGKGGGFIQLRCNDQRRGS
jgi:hypothetical protein